MIIGPIFVIVVLWFTPESPRFLVKAGRAEEAHAILAKFHANGDMDDQLVLWELAEIKSSLITEENTSTGSYVRFFEHPVI
jgi:hypothetical protein